jgi:hypothetical protein
MLTPPTPVHISRNRTRNTISHFPFSFPSFQKEEEEEKTCHQLHNLYFLFYYHGFLKCNFPKKTIIQIQMWQFELYKLDFFQGYGFLCFFFVSCYSLDSGEKGIKPR